MTEAEGANLVSFVTNGGTAVVSFWSGIVDEHDAVYLGNGGPLRPLMGCDVLEVAPQSQGDVLEVEWEDGTRTTASFWADVAAEGDGHVLARIAGGTWAGRPVVFDEGRQRGRLLPGCPPGQRRPGTGLRTAPVSPLQRQRASLGAISNG